MNDKRAKQANVGPGETVEINVCEFKVYGVGIWDKMVYMVLRCYCVRLLTRGSGGVDYKRAKRAKGGTGKATENIV